MVSLAGDIEVDDCEANVSIAHLALLCMAGPGFSNVSDRFTHPGLHGNFFVHGVIGFLHYRSRSPNHNDFAQSYRVSFYASRYLALPCVLADLRRDNRIFSRMHLLSGIIPFTLALTRKDNIHESFGNFFMALNGIYLIFHSCRSGNVWGCFAAGAALYTHFLVYHTGHAKLWYPVGLALLEYCVYKLFSGDSNRRGSAGR